MEPSKTLILVLAIHLAFHVTQSYNYWDRHLGVTTAETAQNMDDLELVLGSKFVYVVRTYWRYFMSDCDVIETELTEASRSGQMKRFCPYVENCPVLSARQSCMVRLVVINIRKACCAMENNKDHRSVTQTVDRHLPQVSPTPTDKEKLLNGQRTCNTGSIRPSRRIVGGTTARMREFPWVGMMLIDNKFDCACTILDRTHALTAAHCFRSVRADTRVEVFAGRHLTNLNVSEPEQQRVFVTSYKIHEKYEVIRTGKIVNDVAVLHFNTPLNWTDAVMPVCLPPKGDTMADRCTVVGWGDTDPRDKVATYPKALQKVTLKTYSKDQCLETFGGKSPDPENLDDLKNYVQDGTICAANGLIGGKDACMADSGGPLLCIKGTSTSLAYFQFGIVSNGLHCGSPTDPGVYTDVVYYLDWIKEAVDSLF